MKRAAYLLSLFDARDRLMVAGLLVVVMLVSGGSFYLKGRADERAVAQAACAQEQGQLEAKWRARGIVAVRSADPCQRGGRR